MTESTADHREPSAMTYVVVWIALAVLATATLLLSRAAAGDWSIVIALAIASVKAAIVGAYFMHLAYGRALHRLAIVVSIGFVVLIVAGIVADVATRSVAGPDLDPRESAEHAPGLVDR